MKKREIIMIIVIIILLLLLGGIVKLPQSFSSVGSGGGVPLNPSQEKCSYDVTLTLHPNPACVGDPITGTISSNIPNGVCAIAYNTDGTWKLYKTVKLNSNGYYSETQVINTPGTALFRAVCCDAQQNCRISNGIELTTQLCASPNRPTDSPDPRMPCASIIPATADNCNQGYCDTGICTYVPATLSTRASCACQNNDCLRLGTACFTPSR